jgi:hypothetical protein
VYTRVRERWGEAPTRLHGSTGTRLSHRYLKRMARWRHTPWVTAPSGTTLELQRSFKSRNACAQSSGRSHCRAGGAVGAGIRLPLLGSTSIAPGLPNAHRRSSATRACLRITTKGGGR